MRSSAIDKTEKSLAEILIIVGMVAIMMAVFVFYFFKHEATLTATGFERLKSNFASQVLIIHAKWMLDGKPNVVQLHSGSLSDKSKTDEFITVNKKGWVKVTNTDFYCEGIWQTIMNMPLKLNKSPISAVEIRYLESKPVNICRYSLLSGEYFDYNTATGQVSEQNKW